MRSIRIFFVLILGILGLIGQASATLITSFEGGSSLADNGLTLTQGGTSRAAIQLSATADGTTINPTSGNHLLRMIAGSSSINPAFPNDLVTLVTFTNPVAIDKQYLLMEFAFINVDSSPQNDRQRIGINSILYDLTGSLETGWHVTPQNTLGWNTLAIDFSNHGQIDLSLGCVNDTYNGASSRCIWDNIRTSNTIPSLAENNGIPIFSSPNIPTITLTSPVTPVPEPETWTLMLLGLIAIGISAFRRDRKILPPLAVAGSFN